MVFNSLTFIIFMAVVLLLHHLPFSWRTKKLNLLLASYIFYAAWNPPFVILLWLSTIVDWFVGRRIYVSRSIAVRRMALLVSLCANLGLLAFFKYGTFLLTNFTMFMNLIGIKYVPAQYDIILPVGISFYTFQTLSYTLDIYSGKAKPWDSFRDYALYVTFFPQLVAGPIVRATDFLPQCETPRKASMNQFSWGLILLIVGLFQKIVVADGLLAPIVEKVYLEGSNADMISAWCGTLAFSGQIFCDFAGYSSCAIGVALCLGFKIPDNFRAPYAAISFSDFWNRWHISLSTWLRDYLYIPLGGNRKGSVHTYINLMLTMLIGGLWHGASWTFVFWGGLHGVYLAIERILREKFGWDARKSGQLQQLLIVFLIFILVCFTWVFFRAKSFGAAFSLTSAMLGMVSNGSNRLVQRWDILIAFATISILLFLHWLRRNESFEELTARLPWWVISILISMMLFTIMTMPGEDRAFIYFQF